MDGFVFRKNTFTHIPRCLIRARHFPEPNIQWMSQDCLRHDRIGVYPTTYQFEQVDLPAPLGPTSPIRCPRCRLKFSFLKVEYRPG